MPTPLEQQILQAKSRMQQEMPDVANSVSIGPMGGLLKSIAPKDSVAVTSPWTGNISYNSDALQGQSQEDINSTLAHELTHSRQVQGQSYPQRFLSGLKNAFSPAGDYNWRPNELEAFQTEHDRSLNQHLPVQGDIQLPPTPKPNQGPKIR